MTRERTLERFLFPGEPRFELPLRPGKVIALGRNYTAHAAESGHDTPEEPILFCKSSSACIGDGQPIVVRAFYGRVEHEAELAVVIGRRCKEAAEEEAGDYIAGYSILNDVTAREMQQADIAKGLPWYRSKSIDTFGPLGPVIALVDAIPEPVAVDIELRVNGEVRQRGNTADMVFSVPAIIAAVSRLITLEPGDVVATGTPAGVGPIGPGDTVEITIPGIGTLRNPVVEERRRRYGVARSQVEA
ncbi:MAG: fumarylacetoacetate hydrolase family protein [Candidatus Hydrogenedentes bacterium]|nr:fumarylacetoacetate hydrolase family protein [Candidatus Hydrogenedentota bacterium]